MPSQAEHVRFLRVINGVFLVVVAVYAVLDEFLGPHGRTVDTILLIAMAVAATGSAGIGLFLRRKYLDQVLPILRTDPENQEALNRWRAGQIVVMVFVVTVAAIGFALRFLGASLPVVVPFYLASAGLLVWLRPSDAIS